MRSARLGLLSSVAMAMVVMAGCTDGTDAADTAAPRTGGDASATPATVAGLDAETKAACATMSADIKSTMAEVAKAEKIGPPAGHSAVSAQYSAGAAGFYAHTFTTSDAVNAAAKQVATAMSDLADTYATAPAKKPSRTTLDTAVKQLTTACAN
ncbi:hypothetical protein Q2K19_25130 [Micromonospora soli]|uniref:hypothetical protein n=1 Tax=Micromonospora sp. NBRC 110009 TaxID=3061627 RepID=UPI002672431A|nr:hypothetical protein [Micromonospora sp. NBRC 110009]WKT97435.1 hypothetical protein Q2K19_25130 [Micromonospora sp. NBRC 110009]